MARHTFLNDVIFKIVFGAEGSSGLVRALINALLGLSGPERITEIEILNPHVDKRYVDEKGGVLDVKARDSAGRLYNIELQVGDELAYVPRVLYYLTRLFAGQAAPGDYYGDLGKTIGISLLDFRLFNDRTDLHSTYRLYDESHGHRLTDLLEVHFIELVKFRQDKPHSLQTPFERWLHILKFGEIYESGSEPLPPELAQEEGIEMAMDRMRTAWANDDLREWIEFRDKARMDEKNRLEYARRTGLAEGLEKGREEGREEGREKGREEGLEKGREEGLEKGRLDGLRDAARRMVDEGMSRDTVCRVLGLAPSDLS